MTDNKQAVTAHGTIEYDTETCDHCGHETVTDEIVGVHLDPYERECSMVCSNIHTEPSAERQLCERCAEALFGYTRGRVSRDYVTRMKWDAGPIIMLTLLALLVFGALLWAVVVLL
jgi:hypothetical protein